MNKRTAAIILDENIKVLTAYYTEEGRPYTFVTNNLWLPETIEQGTALIAQTKNNLGLVYFHAWGKITDLDLDNESIVYKYVLGTVLEVYLSRADMAEAQITSILDQIQHSRVAALRETVKKQLLQISSELS
jgi:predicted XRE-type DNA-binding protein